MTQKAVPANPPPDPCLRFDPQAPGLIEYPRDFFLQDTVYVAREILGAWFAHLYRNKWYGARIVETEAYIGFKDEAAHSCNGRRTPRVEPMYQEGGCLYVYFVYGMHHCANIVTRPAGIAEAVLLRAAEGPEGTPVRLLSGPGKLCAGLGITTASSGLDLLSGGNLRLFQREGPSPSIGVSSRIGVDYAGEARDWPLRFFDQNSKAVSKKRVSG
jgi:DNA-3-methyladenine glycosylase